MLHTPVARQTSDLQNGTAESSEDGRLEALDRYDIIDTPREEAFDRVVRLTRRVLDVPIAIVSVMDAHRQWYKAFEGMSDSEAIRRDTFCKHVVETKNPLIVDDASVDPRFQENPFVLEGGIRAYAGVPLMTADGHAVGTLCAIDDKPRHFTRSDEDILRDLAQVVMSEFELRRTAATDALTGALSRRAFRDALQREVSLAQRHRYHLSCVAIDLDHFKSINDRFGHPAGDAVLAGAARSFQGLMRATDMLGRLGGEEFAVILSHTDAAGALEIAEKLRAVLPRQAFRFGDNDVRVTASFGTATLESGIRDADTLLAHADAALYEAKANGRDRVVASRVAAAASRVRGRRVLKAGLIALNDHSSTIDCTVRTLGGEGAGIDVSSAADIPDQFDLIIKSDDLAKPCEVTFRSERHLEVEFR